jgi:hypothetical protein
MIAMGWSDAAIEDAVSAVVGRRRRTPPRLAVWMAVQAPARPGVQAPPAGLSGRTQYGAAEWHGVGHEIFQYVASPFADWAERR